MFQHILNERKSNPTNLPISKIHELGLGKLKLAVYLSTLVLVFVTYSINKYRHTTYIQH